MVCLRLSTLTHITYIHIFLNRKKLTHTTLMLRQYRNHSIDLECKSIDWFLYEGNIGMTWFKNSSHKKFKTEKSQKT